MGAGMAAQDHFALAPHPQFVPPAAVGEGAFSQASSLVQPGLQGEGGMDEARRFAEEVQEGFLPRMLMGSLLVFVVGMHGLRGP